jgi:hypothetical protein
LAFSLGHLACGMPLDPTAETKPQLPSGYLDAEAALLKIYGPDDSSKSAHLGVPPRRANPACPRDRQKPGSGHTETNS